LAEPAQDGLRFTTGSRYPVERVSTGPLANLAAADANVRRLEQLESFKRVYAPFSGVLVKRNVDPGALINAGSGGVELFILAKVDPLRVFTNVPQAYSPAHQKRDARIHYAAGNPRTEVQRNGSPPRLTRSTPATRTLLTEVDVPNKDGGLLRGSFGEVHFSPKIDVSKITVPVNAMLFRQEGPRVAVVGVRQQSTVAAYHYWPATTAPPLEILGGVSLEDRVIINPADSLEDGQKVHVAADNQQGEHS
jgi:multidrug efflux pump subunit AcrA (membrane-fusion protein)